MFEMTAEASQKVNSSHIILTHAQKQRPSVHFQFKVSVIQGTLIFLSVGNLLRNDFECKGRNVEHMRKFI